MNEHEEASNRRGYAEGKADGIQMGRVQGSTNEETQTTREVEAPTRNSEEAVTTPNGEKKPCSNTVERYLLTLDFIREHCVAVVAGDTCPITLSPSDLKECQAALEILKKVREIEALLPTILDV